MCRFEQLTSVTNVLLLNLLASSLVFMSSLPFLGVYLQLSAWIFGALTCRLVGGVYYLGFYSSVLFLALLTFDRHLLVVYPLSAGRLRTRTYAVVSCAAVWVLSALSCVKPMMLHTTFIHHVDNRTYCQEDPGHMSSMDGARLRRSGFFLQLLLFWLLPLAVISYCYVRIAFTVMSSKMIRKLRTVRLILVIVLLFFSCWTPYNVVLLLEDEGQTCEAAQRRGVALQVTRNIAYVYFCISPVFYTLVGKKFQKNLKQLLVKHVPALSRHMSQSRSSKITDAPQMSAPVRPKNLTTSCMSA